MHDPSAFAFQLPERFRENSGQSRIEHADQLSRRSRGIQKRPEEIENCSHILTGQPLSHLGQRAECRMITSGENKTETVPHNKVCQGLLIVEKRKKPEGNHCGLRKQMMNRLVKLDCSLLKSRWFKGPLYLRP